MAGQIPMFFRPENDAFGTYGYVETRNMDCH